MQLHADRGVARSCSQRSTPCARSVQSSSKQQTDVICGLHNHHNAPIRVCRRAVRVQASSVGAYVGIKSAGALGCCRWRSSSLLLLSRPPAATTRASSSNRSCRMQAADMQQRTKTLLACCFFLHTHTQVNCSSYQSSGRRAFGRQPQSK